MCIQTVTLPSRIIHPSLAYSNSLNIAQVFQISFAIASHSSLKLTLGCISIQPHSILLRCLANQYTCGYLCNWISLPTCNTSHLYFTLFLSGHLFLFYFTRAIPPANSRVLRVCALIKNTWKQFFLAFRLAGAQSVMSSKRGSKGKSTFKKYVSGY